MSINLLYHQAAYARWHTPFKALASHTPRVWQTWLYDKNSLTKRLIRASNGHFSVQVKRNDWGYPSPSEAMALGIPIRQKAIIREVNLLCYGKPWVLARSIIPASTLVGRQKRFINIGSKPLGALLFAHPNMQRGKVQVLRLPKATKQTDAPLAETRVKHNMQYIAPSPYKDSATGWARRSVFKLDKRPILVTEVFLPEVLIHRL